MPSSCTLAPRQYENFRFSHNAKLDTPGFLWQEQPAALKFSRGVLRNSVEFPLAAKFDASRDNDAGHDHRGILASKRILSIASSSGVKTLFRIFLRALTCCFYLAHFPEATLP